MFSDTDASSQLAKAIRDCKEDNVPMRHYNCYIHKLITLEKKCKNCKIGIKLPTNQEKSSVIKILAAVIRTQLRMEINNAKI